MITMDTSLTSYKPDGGLKKSKTESHDTEKR